MRSASPSVDERFERSVRAGALGGVLPNMAADGSAGAIAMALGARITAPKLEATVQELGRA